MLGSETLHVRVPEVALRCHHSGPHGRPQTGTASRGRVPVATTSSSCARLPWVLAGLQAQRRGVAVGGRPREATGAPVWATRPGRPLTFVCLSQAGRVGVASLVQPTHLPSRADLSLAGGQRGAGKGRGQSWPGVIGPHTARSPARPMCRVPARRTQ